MSFVIAVAGKGGTGKSTITALIIRSLIKSGRTPILAIDADPNSNLAESLGIDVKDTIGNTLSDFLRNRGSLPQGVTKQSFLEMKLHQILKEEKDIDIMVMGCPEGPGCYCAANAMMKSYFEDLVGNYRYVVVDNEAGMEHFSRKTAANIDLLLLCSNYSLKGIKTVKKISDMVDELGIGVKERFIVINMTPEKLDDSFIAEIEKLGIPYFGNIKTDKSIEEADVKGIPLTDIPESSMAVKSIDDMVAQLFN